MKFPKPFRVMKAPHQIPANTPSFFKNLVYPLLVSPKLDGIRCVIKNGIALSASGKILPSYQVQDSFWRYDNFDGELIEGSPTEDRVYHRTASHVMSENKFGDIRFYVFDYTHNKYLNVNFFERLQILQELFPLADDNIFLVEHHVVDNEEELLELERRYLLEGYEGLVLKSPLGHYKQGRATYREGLMYKLKRLQDAEGVIIEVYEGTRNTNVQTKNELGLTSRSTNKENMVPSGLCGGFLVKYGEELVSVSPGAFSKDERKWIWENKEEVCGKLLKFRYFNYGLKAAPRQSVAVSFRDPTDMTEY